MTCRAGLRRVLGPVCMMSILAGAVVQARPRGAETQFAAAGRTVALYLPVVSRPALPCLDCTTSGPLESDETWRGNLLITGDVLVPQGVTLTIEPATTVRFTASSDDQHDPSEYDPQDPETLHTIMISILVLGTLRAQGTVAQPIAFTSNSSSPGEADWQSITVEDQGTVVLRHVLIEHGHFGVQLDSVTPHFSMHHSTIRNATTCGICTGGHPIVTPVVISDNQFIGCGREAIDTYRDQHITVHHNVFAENHVGIMSVGSAITVTSNLFTANGRGIGVVEAGTPTIRDNEFTGQQGAAIFVTAASPIIGHNNLHGNIWNVELDGSDRGITAENNWWGSADIVAIEQSIWDGRDDPLLGLVDYQPYATEAYELEVPELK